MTLVSSLSLIILFYVIGSLPFALIFTKLFGLGDIRKVGSGNVGATNVLRTGNKFVAFIVPVSYTHLTLPTIYSV